LRVISIKELRRR